MSIANFDRIERQGNQASQPDATSIEKIARLPGRWFGFASADLFPIFRFW